MIKRYLAFMIFTLFTINIYSVKGPQVIGPTKDSAPQPLDPVLTWKPIVKPGIYYEVRLAEDKNFTINLIQLKTTSPSLKFNLPYFQKGRSYYWTLRAVYTEGQNQIETSWTHDDKKDKEYYRFSIQPDASGFVGYMPFIISPGPDEVLKTLQPEFRWSYPDHSDANFQVKNNRNEYVSPRLDQITYRLEIASSPDFSLEIKSFEIRNDSSNLRLTIPWFKKGNKYYWRVRAEYTDPEKNSRRESQWSSPAGKPSIPYSFSISSVATGFFTFDEGQKEEVYDKNKLNNVVRITPPNIRCFAPAVSKDGQKLAFCSDRYGPIDVFEINLTDRIGAGTGTQKTSSQRGKFSLNPFWLNNNEIAFYSNRMGEFFWIFSIFKGPSQTQRNDLNNQGDPENFELYGSCSGDGKMVFGVKLKGSETSDIFLVDFVSGDRVNLTQGLFPDIRNDDRIVYANNNSDDPNDFEIYISNLERNGITDNRLVTNDPGRDYDPVLSPDGTRIAFTSTRFGNSDIYVMDTDGGNVRQVTFHPMVDRRPQWIDNTNLVFQSNRENENKEYITGIWRVEVPKINN